MLRTGGDESPQEIRVELLADEACEWGPAAVIYQMSRQSYDDEWLICQLDINKTKCPHLRVGNGVLLPPLS